MAGLLKSRCHAPKEKCDAKLILTLIIAIHLAFQVRVAKHCLVYPIPDEIMLAVTKATETGLQHAPGEWIFIVYQPPPWESTVF